MKDIPEVRSTVINGVELYMNNERKHVARSFVAKHPGICCDPGCTDPITTGQRARYNPNGDLVHHRHKVHYPPEPKVCDQCWLTKPCECD